MLLPLSSQLEAQPEQASARQSPQPALQHHTSCHSEKRVFWGKTITLQQQKGGKLPSHDDIPPEPALTHSKHQAHTCCFPAPEEPCRSTQRKDEITPYLSSHQHSMKQ